MNGEKEAVLMWLAKERNGVGERGVGDGRWRWPFFNPGGGGGWVDGWRHAIGEG
jgi:hypothetical protein